MSIVLLQLWGHTERPWGYEIRADYQDSETGMVVGEVLEFPAVPEQPEIDAAVLARQIHIATRPLPARVQTQTIQASPVTVQIEAAKEYLKMAIVGFVGANPAASFADMRAHIALTYGWQDELLAARLVYDYATIASGLGLLTYAADSPDELYAAVREFIGGTPLADLKILLGVA